MLKLSLCHYSDTYILVKGTISIEAQEGDNPNNGDKEVEIAIIIQKYQEVYGNTIATLTNADTVPNFHPAYNSALFKFK